VLGADDDGQAGTVDVGVEQVHHPLLLLHHLEERPEGLQGEAVVAGVLEQRGDPFHVERLGAGELLQRGLGQPQRACAELVEERPLLAQAREHGLPHLEQGQPAELRVEIAGRARQVVGPHRLAGVHHLLGDLVAPRHDDDEHLRAAERDELDALQDGRVAGREREAHVPRGPRHQVRHARQQAVGQRRALGVVP
jgi:hypothetical protein